MSIHCLRYRFVVIYHPLWRYLYGTAICICSLWVFRLPWQPTNRQPKIRRNRKKVLVRVRWFVILSVC